ncbi:MAG: hypothetical protein Tsb0013_02470 [Phycisphaerales bacterium]
MHDEIPSSLTGACGAILVVRIPPDLNHLTADKLRACVEARLPEHSEAGVVLDASSVVLITSVGIASLLQVQEFARARGVGMCIAGLKGEALRFLEMLRLEHTFPLFDDEEDGVAWVQSRD